MTYNFEIEFDQDGRELMIEPETHPNLTRRVFRRTANNRLEYCILADWRENKDRARFYGYAPTELPESMCAKHQS